VYKHMYESLTDNVAKDRRQTGFIDSLNANIVRMFDRGLSFDDATVIVTMASFLPGVFCVVYDCKGNYLWLSPWFSSVVGDKMSDLLGQSIFDKFPESWCRERLALFNKTIQERRPYVIVEIFCGRRLEGMVLPVYQASGEVLVAYVGRCGLSISLPPEVVQSSKGDHLVESVLLTQADWGPLADLTRRELEVLRLIAMGFDNTQIAKTIHRTKRAVEWHVSHLYEVLRLTQRTELFRIGLGAGLPEIEEAHWQAMIENVHDGRSRESASLRPLTI
jgi:DNA-binding CsgD family transcriptional regulator